MTPLLLRLSAIIFIYVTKRSFINEHLSHDPKWQPEFSNNLSLPLFAAGKWMPCLWLIARTFAPRRSVGNAKIHCSPRLNYFVCACHVCHYGALFIINSIFTPVNLHCGYLRACVLSSRQRRMCLLLWRHFNFVLFWDVLTRGDFFWSKRYLCWDVLARHIFVTNNSELFKLRLFGM